jgi:APA family basic amino acid/polyamine antiporter
MSAPPPRVLGFWAAVSIVMGNMIGSGVFLLPASLASYRGLSLAGWAVSAGGAVLLALVFARLARQLPATGGLYAYTRAAFGDFAGFLVAWGYWLSIVGTLAALAVALVGYLDPFIPSVVRAPGAAAALAIATVWIVIGVNIAGVGLVGRVQVVTTALKIMPLAVVGVGGLLYFQPDAFALPATTTAPMGTQLLTVVTLTLWAFLGLECATIPAGSVRDPARTIPLATVVGTVVTAIIYVVSTVGVMSLVPPEALATSTAPFADAAAQLLGGAGGQLVAIGAAISCFGALNGWALMAAQLPMAAAADGLFPPVFGQLSTRGTPARDDHRRGTCHRARGDELLARARRALHLHHPAVHLEHARALRLLLAGGVVDAGSPAATWWRGHGERARLCLLDVRDWRSRRGDGVLRVSPAARWTPGLCLAAPC